MKMQTIYPIQKKMDVTPINSINATNYLYMNYYETFIHKYYAQF